MTETIGDYTETTADAAKYLGVNARTVSRWAAKGDIAHIVTPGNWRMFRLADLEAFQQRILRRDEPDTAA